MKKLILIATFLCSTLLADTVPNELRFLGENLIESHGKRISGDEVATVHNFKLSDSGWSISYRADGIGSFLGISSWTRLTYTGSVGQIDGNNGKPRLLDRAEEIRRPYLNSPNPEFEEIRRPYLNSPNPEFEEWHLKYKEFVSSDRKIQLRVFEDGEAVIFISKDGLTISQNLRIYSYDSNQRSFMKGVYKNNN